MKKVQLRNVTHEEMEAKKIVLEASGVFPAKFLQILNRGGMNGLEFELSDEQCQVLKALNLVEREGDIEATKKEEIGPTGNEHNQVVENEAASEPTVLASDERDSQSELEQNREEAERLEIETQERNIRGKRRREKKRSIKHGRWRREKKRSIKRER